jgi:glycosyltransferase involved in cell wall biosynthesis
MKQLTICIPCFNEQDNILDLVQELKKVILPYQSKYDVKIMFIDNDSTDLTRAHISKIANEDQSILAIFNAMNFGFVKSQFYGLTQAPGDAVILMAADLQDPPSTLPLLIEKWEQGYKVVTGIVKKSKENILMFLIRKLYYKIIHRLSDINQIEHFNGYALYSRDFIEVIKNIKDPQPYLRGMVAELGFKRANIYYEQAKRLKGETKFNFFKLYDLAMLGITSYSKSLMRISTLLGFALALVSFLIGFMTLLIKLFNWNNYPVGTAAMIIGIFVLGSIQLFFIGMLGEYILNINARLLNRPLVVEEKRINF